MVSFNPICIGLMDSSRVPGSFPIGMEVTERMYVIETIIKISRNGFFKGSKYYKDIMEITRWPG